jgi:hypothetical protein
MAVNPPLAAHPANGMLAVAMYARVVSLQVRPEDVESSARLFEEAVIPARQADEGFVGALFLVREDGTAMAIHLADTLDHLHANERTGLYQSVVAQFRDRFVGHPHREIFRVAVSEGLPGQTQGPE